MHLSKAKLLIQFLLFLVAAGATVCRLTAAEFTAKFTDGLGRPLAEVAVEIQLRQEGSDGKVLKTEHLNYVSDRAGLVRGTYDEKVFPTSKLWVQVKKAGYQGYSTGLREEYTLNREFQTKDVRRTARLKGEAQQIAMKELLVGRFRRGAEGDWQSLDEVIFCQEREFRPVLRSLLPDAQVGMKAGRLLAFIGAPEDLRLVLQHATPPKRNSSGERWAYPVASALLEPTTEAEWEFLKRCALGDYDDLWAQSGAISSLGLIASPRSLEILGDAAKKETARRERLIEKITRIRANPPVLTDPDLVAAGKKVAQAVKVGNWEDNGEPRFNDEEDMALIDFHFVSGRDALTYTATFHKVGDIWKLRGVRETMQALMGYPPERKSFIGVWHGFDQDHLMFGRLELKEDGTGWFALSQLPKSAPDAYQVKQWSLEGSKLGITLKPVGPDAETITLTNALNGISSLGLEVHGQNGWNSKMSLFNEKSFQGRAGKAKKSLDALRTTK